MSPRPFGLCAGSFTVPDDFDAPLPEEILQDFEGEKWGQENLEADDRLTSPFLHGFSVDLKKIFG